MADQKLNLIINGKNNAGPAVSSLKSGLKGLSTATLGLTAGFAGVVIGLKKSLNSFASFEARLAEINTIAKLNKKGLKEVEKGLVDLSKRVPKSADELGAGFYQILSAGIKDTSKALEILEVSTKLAVGGIAETGDTVKLVTGIINAYGFEVEKATEISDILFKTVENGVTTIAELAQFMGPLIPISKAAGLSIEEVTAAIATLTASGTPSRVAITALRTAIFSLSAPADAAKEKMEEMGITFKDNLIDTIIQFQGLDLGTIRKLIPEKEAAGAILSLADNYKKFGENVESAFDSGGAALDAFNEQMDTTSANIQLLANSWDNFQRAIGSAIGRLIRAFVNIKNEVTDLAGDFKKWWTEVNNLNKVQTELGTVTKRLVEVQQKENKTIEDYQALIRAMNEKITETIKLKNLTAKGAEFSPQIKMIRFVIATYEKELKILKDIKAEKEKTEKKTKVSNRLTIAQIEAINDSLEKENKKTKERIETLDEEIKKEEELEKKRTELTEKRLSQAETIISFEDALGLKTEENKEKVTELIDAMTIGAEFMAATVAASIDAIGASFTVFFNVMFTRNKNFAEQMKDVWRNLVGTILNMIGQLIARMIALQVLTSLFPGGKIIGEGFKQIFGRSLAGMFGLSMQTPHGTNRVIPGPPNMPVPFMGHGGESVGRKNGGNGGITLVVQGDFLNTDESAAKIYELEHDYRKRNNLP